MNRFENMATATSGIGRNASFQLGMLIGRCPKCHSRSFRYYVDGSGRPLSRRVGRCTRGASCGFSYGPAAFFDECASPLPSSSYGDGRRLFIAESTDYDPCRPTDFVARRNVDISLNYCREGNRLRQWFVGRFGEERTNAVFSLYGVGGSRLLGGSTLFWLIDRHGRVRTGKVMAYSGADDEVVGSDPPKMYIHRLFKPDFNMKRCFFGEHLAARYADARLLLVEDELSALFLAMRIGEDNLRRLLPVAVGRVADLSVDVRHCVDADYMTGILDGRRVAILSDVASLRQWVFVASDLQGVCSEVRIVDLSPYCKAETATAVTMLMERSKILM